MLRIAIVDDENAVCAQIERYLLEVSKRYNISLDIDVFYRREEFCEHIQTVFYDVVFLDIELDAITGIEVNQAIRVGMNNEAMQIIFISGKTEYAIELFDFEPLHFLIKPLSLDQIDHVFRKIIRKLHLNAQCFTFKSGHTVHKIPLKDILYFESDKRKINLYCVGCANSFYGSLEDVMQQVRECGFIQIHQCYLVHVLYVKGCSYSELTMCDGTVLPISQSRRKDVRAFMLEQFKE